MPESTAIADPTLQVSLRELPQDINPHILHTLLQNAVKYGLRQTILTARIAMFEGLVLPVDERWRDELREAGRAFTQAVQMLESCYPTTSPRADQWETAINGYLYELGIDQEFGNITRQLAGSSVIRRQQEPTS